MSTAVSASSILLPPSYSSAGSVSSLEPKIAFWQTQLVIMEARFGRIESLPSPSASPMPPAMCHQSSAFEMDARKQKRKLSNRESARRSRMKKQQHVRDLTNQVVVLTTENRQLAAQVDGLVQHHLVQEVENGELRAQEVELTERLRSLSSVLRLAEELSGVVMPGGASTRGNPLAQYWA